MTLRHAMVDCELVNSRVIEVDVDCETCYTSNMTSLTIRDLRQRWPEAEKALETEEEILITRDGKPVAKLMRYSEPTRKRRRFDPEKHLKEMRRFWGGKTLPSFEKRLIEGRADRWER
jgi:antitoxin (DNA-binding transcriptional repressor) of toxin-antitoxin stability system